MTIRKLVLSLGATIGCALALSACASTRDSIDAAALAPIAPISSVVLTSTGLQIDGAARGVGRFGSSEADVTPALTRVFDTEAVSSDNPDCPGGPLTIVSWTRYMWTTYKDGKLVGWLTEDPVLGTPAGVRLGWTRSQVEALPDFATPPTKAAAIEIKADGVSGFITEGPDGYVELLWSGEVCL
ncbi:hypothetical protein BH10PSE2_BH10PSE2_18670 [soil metagenome]